MFAKATAAFVPIAAPWRCRYSLFVILKEFSSRMSLSISLRQLVGIRGLLLQNLLYAAHTICIPCSCGMFVLRLVTPIVTSSVFCGSL